MNGYKWRDPARWKPPASEKEMPPGSPRDLPETACVYCGQTGEPLKTIRGKDPVCVDDEACLSRGWDGVTA
jgi:hypothetical protein